MSQKLIVLVSPELVKSANLWSAKCAEGYQNFEEIEKTANVLPVNLWPIIVLKDFLNEVK